MNYCVGDELFLSDKQGSVILRVVPHISDRTNADLTRAMSDEKLAEFAIMSSKFFCTKKYNEVCEKPMGCTECALNWLQQPAPEVSNETDT